MAKFWLLYWGLMVAWYPLLSSGYLNVFISHKEVMKLMRKYRLLLVHFSLLLILSRMMMMMLLQSLSSLAFASRWLFHLPFSSWVFCFLSTFNQFIKGFLISLSPRAPWDCPRYRDGEEQWRSLGKTIAETDNYGPKEGQSIEAR